MGWAAAVAWSLQSSLTSRRRCRSWRQRSRRSRVGLGLCHGLGFGPASGGLRHGCVRSSVRTSVRTYRTTTSLHPGASARCRVASSAFLFLSVNWLQYVRSVRSLLFCCCSCAWPSGLCRCMIYGCPVRRMRSRGRKSLVRCLA